MQAASFLGIDGSRGGWVVASVSAHRQQIAFYFAENLMQLDHLLMDANAVWIDLPMALSGFGIVRMLDHELRQHLKWRKASVFVPPSYEALRANDYQAANKIEKRLYDRGISQQAWNLRGKIQEVHSLLNQYELLKQKLHESHPELVFQRFWHHRTPLAPKRSPLGARQRLEIISRFFPDAEKTIMAFLHNYARKLFRKDDLLDALVLAIKASMEKPEVIKQFPECDANGLPLKVVF
jgi:predicted RNase H-like nuclease